MYSEDQLASLGVDPFGVTGNSDLGWKMAICERDVAIYVGLLAVALLYARRPALVRPMGFGLYGLLILPMAVDGFTQLLGWRESTWELRVLTGALFGVASAWLVLPRLQEALAPSCASARPAGPILHPRDPLHPLIPPAPGPGQMVLAAQPASDAQPRTAGALRPNPASRQPPQDTRATAERYAPAEEPHPLACDPPFPHPSPHRRAGDRLAGPL